MHCFADLFSERWLLRLPAAYCFALRCAPTACCSSIAASLIPPPASFIDYGSAGSLAGMAANAESILKMVDDDAVIVPEKWAKRS